MKQMRFRAQKNSHSKAQAGLDGAYPPFCFTLAVDIYPYALLAHA